MQAPQQQLGLKDIHLPDAVSWWPLASGYWIIIAFIIICIILYFAITNYKNKYKIKKIALAEFYRLKKEYTATLNKKQLVTSLSELIRRAAISTYPRSDCASLTGKNWLNWLDKQIKKSSPNFSNGPGYLLTDFVYSKQEHSDDINQLLNLSYQWIKQLPAVKNTSRQKQ
ncbi:MAG: DUF4381 domain-containing protein [Gammaproteobacteria bacterium]|nr:DUF4381 domain-containing protein [Gammaproteobacteria bacterium]